MAREISLSARTAFNAQETDQVAAVLVTITHESLSVPVRLSSDPTQRLSTEPLRYGTLSNGQEYEFVLMAAVLPDDQEGAPPRAALAFLNVTKDMAEPIRAIRTPASVDLAVVLSSAPDDIEEQYTALKAVSGSYDSDRVTLDISREPITAEPYPAFRMTRSRFPGLFR